MLIFKKLIGTEGTDSGGMQRHVETPQAQIAPRRLHGPPRGKHVPGVEINNHG